MTTYYGPGFRLREESDPVRDGAIRTVMEWFDLDKMAAGLRWLDRDAQFRRDRAKMLRTMPGPRFRWWNRPVSAALAGRKAGRKQP